MTKQNKSPPKNSQYANAVRAQADDISAYVDRLHSRFFIGGPILVLGVAAVASWFGSRDYREEGSHPQSAVVQRVKDNAHACQGPLRPGGKETLCRPHQPR